MKTNNIFPTSYWSGEIEFDVKEIIGYLDLIKMTGNVIVNSNVGGYHSPIMFKNDIPNLPNSIGSIFNELDKHVNTVYKDYYGIEKEPELSNFWFMCNERYNYNASHNHPGAFLSGVVYIKVPYNSGDLVLERPDNFMDGVDPYIVNDTEYNKWLVKIRPKVGNFVLFPWNLKHSVNQNLSDEQDSERIALAFNYR
jgi:uncharacterized protein (TIGR02466 family)